MTSSRASDLARFGHHPDPAIDFCVEVEELESIAEKARLGLAGFGHEEDRAGFDARVEKALDFRVGGDEQAVAAKGVLRQLTTGRGFNLFSATAYAGQPVPRSQP
jgi:hypothetical protein